MVEVKGMTIGKGMPKVCVPVVETNDQEIIEKLKEFDTLDIQIIELRIDFYENITNKEALASLFAQIKALDMKKVLLLTYRSAKEGGQIELEDEDYFNLYHAAIASGAFDIYDVELSAGTNKAIELRQLIHGANKYMLMSFHNFDRTPEGDSLMQKFRSMDSLEADIMKIAVMPEDYQDVLNLLSFSNHAKEEYPNKPIVTISMSDLGLSSRLLGEQFGSAITFGCVGKTSAPGQINIDDLNQTLRIIHKNIEEA